MKRREHVVVAVGLTALLGGVLLRSQPRSPSGQDPAATREAAYRENNIGVARLEQFDAGSAADSFRKALAIAPDLAIAQVNLAIALFYAPDLPAAQEAAEAAARAVPDLPQPHYILGLIAKAENRVNEAMASFTRVLEIDPRDVGALVNLGQLELQRREYDAARAIFERAVEAEPYNATAAYNLAVSLLRAGRRDEGAGAMKEFQALRESGVATTFSNTYLEQGRYAEAMASTGAEPELVDEATPDVTFAPAPDVLPGEAPRGQAESPARGVPAGGVTLIDLEQDGDLDLIHADERLGVRAYVNDGGRFTDASANLGLGAKFQSDRPIAAIGGDYDNDGRTDLFILGAEAHRLLWQNANGAFEDRTESAAIARPSHRHVGASFVDVDHDGDLDLVLVAQGAGGEGRAGTAPPAVLLRNNGDGTFTDVAEAAQLGAVAASQIVPTDFDNRRDVDLLMAGGSAPMLFRNMRDGTFRDVAGEVGLPQEPSRAAAAADVNKDGYTDFFFSTSGAESRGVLMLSTGDGRFEASPSGPQPVASGQAQFVDYDDDGLLDLVVLAQQGFEIWRNLGSRWEDVSEAALPDALRRPDQGQTGQRYQSFASGDLDGDGDTDLVTRAEDSTVSVWRGEGRQGNRSVQVRMTAQVSNRSAYGAKVEMRAGSLWQKLEHVSTWPAAAPADVAFGLGPRRAADVIRVLWPAGILQAEIPEARAASAEGPQIVALTELDRKPSSCPYLFTWNGERFEFVTDFLGGGEMGYLLAPGLYNTPDPVEYVRIRPGQLRPRDGRYEIRVTNELEEALYLDHVRLAALSHPADVEVYPNEGMTHTPKPFRLFVVRDARVPARAIDHRGRDVTDRIARLDRRFVDGPPLEKIRGYAEMHALTLDLGNAPSTQHPAPSTEQRAPSTLNPEPSTAVPVPNASVLLLTGWTDYAFSSDNLAAHQAGLELVPPVLQVKDAEGRWQTVIDDVGIPVGRPQTVPVDLRGEWLSSSREVRILTSMRIYWDQIRVAIPVEVIETPADSRLTWLDPVRADLRWRGFSAEALVTDDGRQPLDFDYARVSFVSPWKVMQGRYTREGDVRTLLQARDDKLVISRPGDEIALSFNAADLAAPGDDRPHTFLLYADGFSKEMDVNSASPDATLPLPFHGMTRYPYAEPEAFPDTPDHRRYREEYNTRVVGREVPPVEETIAWGQAR